MFFFSEAALKAFLVFRLIDLIMVILYVLLWGLHVVRKFKGKISS